MTRLNLALAVAIGLAGWSLAPLTQDRLYLLHLAAMLLASVGIGAAARALRAPEPLARLLQLAPGLAVLWWLWEQWPELIGETTRFVIGGYAPMVPHDGFRVLSVGVLWLLYVVAEAIAAGLERPGWTFPVLVLPYLIPALVLDIPASPFDLALACAGYVAVLATAVHVRAVGDLTAGRRRLARGIGISAAAVGVAAWALSGIAATTIPERGAALLDPNRLDGTVQLGDPTLDLVRNLRSPVGTPVMSYSSSDGRGHYLRLAAMSAFDAQGFHLVPTDLLPGTPTLPGGVDADSVTLQVEVGGFASEWLPVPWMPSRVDAAGDWRHDPATGAIIAIGTDRTAATWNLAYQVDARLMRPDPQRIAAAEAGDPGDRGLTLGLPEELDPRVVELAHQVTGDAGTAGERTLALAGWLASEEFTYSTANVDGSTLDTVSDFLLDSRTGYCEQFAGSLAILARAVGIPSRVVVGFLPGKADAGRYLVSTKDMHAWTEVYLEGLGWVALDATPSGAPGASPVPSPDPTTSSPTPSESPAETATPTATAAPSQPPLVAPDGAGGFRLPGWTGWLAAAVVLALVPAGLRQLRTWLRLRPGRDPVRAAEDAWDEVRDTVLDLGLPWPEGTPRQVAGELAARIDGPAAAGVRKLGEQVEQARFAPAVDRVVDPADVQRLTAALVAAAGGWPATARVLPRSVFRRVS